MKAAKLMLEDYDEYCRARMFTMIHAKPSGRQEKVLEGNSLSLEMTRLALKKAKSEKSRQKDKKKSLRRL